MKKTLVILMAVVALGAMACLALAQANAPPTCPSAYAIVRGLVIDSTGTFGTITHGRLICKNCTDATQKCDRQSSKNSHGGVREWCACNGTSGEPQGCHVVFYMPGKGEGGGPTQVLCAGSCTTGNCKIKVTASGKDAGGESIDDVTCACQ